MAEKLVKLTAQERSLLVHLIHAVEVSEWDAGDYNLSQRQFNALQNAKKKLEVK